MAHLPDIARRSRSLPDDRILSSSRACMLAQRCSNLCLLLSGSTDAASEPQAHTTSSRHHQWVARPLHPGIKDTDGKGIKGTRFIRLADKRARFRFEETTAPPVLGDLTRALLTESPRW